MSTETIPTSPLEAALLPIINNTTQAVGKGVDFLAEQIPDVIHQLLMWKAVESFIWFVITLLAGFLVVYLCVRLWKSDELDGIEPVILFPIAISGGLFSFAFNHLDWLQIWIAPKVWLIEYAARLVKGH